MQSSIPQFHGAFARLAAFLIFTAGAALPAPGQQPDRVAPHAHARVSVQELVPPEPVAEFDSAIPLPTSPPVGACAPDFWIVSSRSAPQECAHCAAGAPLDFFQTTCGSVTQWSNEEQFVASINPEVPVCIVVHGSFVDWRSVLFYSQNTYRWIRAAAPELPLQIVFFTWPSNDRNPFCFPTIDVRILGGRSEFNALYVARVIQMIPPQTPVSLMGHSHGARLVTSTLHLLGGGCVDGNAFPSDGGHRIRAVLAAGALDHSWLNPGKRHGRALCRAECVLNVYNRHDPALAVYPVTAMTPQHAIGYTGLSASDRRRLGSHGAKIRELDVTGIIGFHHVWPSYYQEPKIGTAVLPYVYYADARPHFIGPPAPFWRGPFDLLREGTTLEWMEPRRNW